MSASKTLTAFNTLAMKEINRICRIWTQTLLPQALTSLLYVVIFGQVLGKHISIRQHGVSYIAFLAPGLMMMSIINSSYVNSVSSFFSARFSGCIEELLVAPVPYWVIILGYFAGSLFRAVCVATIVYIIVACYTPLPIHSLALLIVLTLLTSFLFSLAGLINGVFAKNFDQVNFFPAFILTPLTYLGGVFYSIDMLPHFWRQLSLLNPLAYIISAYRYALLGTQGSHLVIHCVALLVGLNVVLCTLLLALFNRRVKAL